MKGRGVSLLLTTHDLGAAYEICDRIVVMYAGQEAEAAPNAAFFAAPRHPYTAKLLESLPRTDAVVNEIRGEIPSLIDPPPGCRFHTRCDYATEECRNSRPPVSGSLHTRLLLPSPGTRAMTVPLLETADLAKSFALKDGQRLRAVDGVDFAVAQGEILGIVGEIGMRQVDSWKNADRRISPRCRQHPLRGEHYPRA